MNKLYQIYIAAPEMENAKEKKEFVDILIQSNNILLEYYEENKRIPVDIFEMIEWYQEYKI